MEKLFVVVDASLKPGAKACQAVHAARQFAADFPETEAEWWARSNTIALLESPDLASIEAQMRAVGVPCSRFVEPDFAPDGVLTALAIAAPGKRYLRTLKLALAQ